MKRKREREKKEKIAKTHLPFFHIKTVRHSKSPISQRSDATMMTFCILTLRRVKLKAINIFFPISVVRALVRSREL